MSDPPQTSRSATTSTQQLDDPTTISRSHNTNSRERHPLNDVLAQIGVWVKEEKSKRTIHRAKKKNMHGSRDTKKENKKDTCPSEVSSDLNNHRRDSDSSDASLALEKLEDILAKSLSVSPKAGPSNRRPSTLLKHRPSSRRARRLSTFASSDTDYQDGDVNVPNCEAVLDNSKTCSSLRNLSSSRTNPVDNKKVRTKDLEAWSIFKYEIVRLAHTLRLKGWRQVPMEHSSEIEVERLSGALTNAVYVVSPPKSLHQSRKESHDTQNGLRPRRAPRLVITNPSLTEIIVDIVQ